MADNIKAIILDFDGVILESVDIKTEAFRELFSRYMDNVDGIVAYHLENNGVSRFIKFKYIWENFLHKKYDENAEDMLGEEFSKIVFEKVVKCPFVAGAEEFLNTVSKKVPLYVASAVPSDELSRIVERRSLEKYFSGIYGTPYKKLDIIKNTMAKENASPQQIVYIGDSVEDWKAAKSAGVTFIGRRNKENLEKLGVPVYDDMRQINGLLSSLFYSDIKKMLYVNQYLKLINGLTAQYNSRCWFSTFTAAKNRNVSKLFEEMYNFILSPDGFKRKKTARFPCIRFYILSFMRILRAYFRIFLVRLILSSRLKSQICGSEKDVYLLRSWFYPTSVDAGGNYKDSFFGILPKYLEENGRRVIILGAVFSSRYYKTIKNISRSGNEIVIPQEYFLSFMDPVRAFIYILKYRTRIKDDIFFMGHNVTEIVRFHLNKDFSDNALEQMLSFYLMKNLVRKIGISTYIFTYENNPWEKMALDAIKTYSPGTKTIGYQHTIVSLGKLSMTLGKDEKRSVPVPDKIIANGPATRDVLIRYGGFPADRVKEGCALRFNLKDSIVQKPRTDNRVKAVLVALAGLYQSAGVLNIAYQAFKDRSGEYKVIIRTHPALPLNEMKRYLVMSPEELPDNFILSDKSNVEEDLARADIMLYDESSLCLNSLLMGVPAIHINTDRIASIDPLFECNHLKKNAGSPSEILSAIEYFSKLSDAEFAKEEMLAREYVKSYLRPVSQEALRLFL